MTAKKSVLQLSIHKSKIRKKAFVKVSGFSGVNSVTMDDKTGKMTIIGEVDVSVIVMKLRKICNAEIISVEDVKPSEKKSEPAEVLAYPFTMNYQYQFSAPCADYYYQPCSYSRVVVEEPNPCIIM